MKYFMYLEIQIIKQRTQIAGHFNINKDNRIFMKILSLLRCIELIHNQLHPTENQPKFMTYITVLKHSYRIVSNNNSGRPIVSEDNFIGYVFLCDSNSYIKY